MGDKTLKQWWVQLDGEAQGPFSVEELQRNWRLTPDTLVKKTKWRKWRLLRDVEELSCLFQDELPLSPQGGDGDEGGGGKKVVKGGEAVLLTYGLPPFLFWALVVALLLLLCFHFFQMQK